MNEKTSNIIAWALILLLVAAGIYFFGTSPQEKTQTILSTLKTPEATTQTISKQGTDNRYIIVAHYPQFDGLPEEKRDKLNQAILEFIQKEIYVYEQEALEFPTFNGSDIPPGTFNSDYKVQVSSRHIVSVQFNISTYMSGAAHPFSYATGFTYDIENESQTTLTELFTANSDYLERLSDLTRTKLLQNRAQTQETPMDQQQEQWIREGTLPKDQNFAEFVLAPDELIIFFNPYQVAPYAEGIQEVHIPYQDIKGILSNSGPASYLTAN